jgi:hypothetical protein
MKLTKTAEGWVLELEWLERVIIVTALEQQATHYRTPLDQLDPVLQAHWRGRLSLRGGEKAKEASEDLAEVRAGWRGERLQAIERWLQVLNLNDVDQVQSLGLTVEEIETLVQVFNERRLVLAAEYGIGDAAMEADLESGPVDQTQRAVMEIHLLGVVLHVLISALDGELE